VLDVLLFIFLAICVYTDIAKRKVYNFTTFPVIILGIGFNLLYFGLPGLKDSLSGFAVGFIFMFIFYLLGGLGGGDVKFMAAVGAVKGFDFAVMGGFYGAIVGGIGAIIAALLAKRLWIVIKRLFLAIFCFFTFRSLDSLKMTDEKSIYLPYTVFLSVGILIRWFEINLK
jgi:prepilin peptidase CpaA